MKRGILIILLLFAVVLIAGCTSKFVTKECLYNQDGSWKAMGVLCNDGLSKCLNITNSLEKFKGIETEKVGCVITHLQKISNGQFINCVTDDDCYRILNIQKPFDDFNVLVCDQEFCKTTDNYFKDLVKGIGTEAPSTGSESNIIPLAPVETANTTVSNTNINKGLSVAETGCGEGVCAGSENCANCPTDCGCTSAVAYCNDTISEPMCKPLPKINSTL